MQFIDIKGAILADTVYVDGELVGREITVTLPDVSFATAEHKAMGTLELPMLGQLEAMEASVTKTGYDKGVAQLTAPEAKNLEFRFVHDSINSDNIATPEGCKAFMRACLRFCQAETWSREARRNSKSRSPSAGTSSSSAALKFALLTSSKAFYALTARITQRASTAFYK